MTRTSEPRPDDRWYVVMAVTFVLSFLLVAAWFGALLLLVS